MSASGIDINHGRSKVRFNQINKQSVKIGREKENAGCHRTGQIPKREVIVGVTEDHMLGHVMMLVWRIYAELIKDTALSLHP